LYYSGSYGRGSKNKAPTSPLKRVSYRRPWQLFSLFWGGLGDDGVHYTEGIDEGCAGVHGHGDAEGFGDFFFGGAGFKGRVGVEHDATIAPGGDGNGEGDELAELAPERVWYPLRESGDSLANCGMVLLSSD
jgi:hypothetical protein